MSKMKKCPGCEKVFKPETDEEMFCSEWCRTWCRRSVESMIRQLKSDEDLFSIFDHVQLLYKKRDLGGEGS